LQIQNCRACRAHLYYDLKVVRPDVNERTFAGEIDVIRQNITNGLYMHYWYFWGSVEYRVQLHLYETGHKSLGKKNYWQRCREALPEWSGRMESPSKKQSFKEHILFSED